MSALPRIPDPEPFDLDALRLDEAIAEVLAEKMEGIRQSERDAMCDAVARGGFLEWLREHDKAIAVALTPAAIWIVAWIAEQTMRSV